MKNPIPPEVAAQGPVLAAELGQTTGELNDALHDAEEAMIGWKLGVAAHLELGRNDSQGRPLCLRFGKHKDAWGLFITLADHKDRSFKKFHVTEATRELRMRALEKVPDLARAVLDEARRQIAEMREAIRKCKEFVASVRQRA